MKKLKKRKALWHKHRDYLQAEVSRLVNKANRGLQPERRVTYAAAIEVANRALKKNANPFSAARAFGAIRAVNSFIEFATRGKDVVDAYKYADLLPVGHPSSTKANAMTAGALRHARARWHAADPLVDDELRPLVAAAHAAGYLTPERDYLFARLAAAPRSSVPLWLTIDNAEAIVAGALSLIGGNSSAARRARAQLQRRDRRGRFAFMGGGFSFNIKIGDVFRSLSGRVVGASGDNDVDIEVINDPDLPDGIYSLPANKGTGVKAIIAPKKGAKRTVTAVDKDAIDASTLKRKDIPGGWEAVKPKELQQLSPGSAKLWRSADGYFVEQTPDGELILRRTDFASNKPGTEVARSRSWADISKSAREDQDDYAKLIDEEAAKERGAQGEVADLDPAKNITSQISDAVSSGKKVRFSYNGKERIITPEKISTGEKSGKRNLLGKDSDGNTKSFTLDKIEAPGEPGPQAEKPVDVPENAVQFDPDGDIEAQLQQAIDNNAPIAFDYNGKTRVVYPTRGKDNEPYIYTNPKNGNVNVVGNEANSETEKTYTVSKMSKVGEGGAPAEAPAAPEVPAEAPQKDTALEAARSFIERMKTEGVGFRRDKKGNLRSVYDTIKYEIKSGDPDMAGNYQAQKKALDDVQAAVDAGDVQAAQEAMQRFADMSRKNPDIDFSDWISKTDDALAKMDRTPELPEQGVPATDREANELGDTAIGIADDIEGGEYSGGDQDEALDAMVDAVGDEQGLTPTEKDRLKNAVEDILAERALLRERGTTTRSLDFNDTEALVDDIYRKDILDLEKRDRLMQGLSEIMSDEDRGAGFDDFEQVLDKMYEDDEISRAEREKAMTYVAENIADYVGLGTEDRESTASPDLPEEGTPAAPAMLSEDEQVEVYEIGGYFIDVAEDERTDAAGNRGLVPVLKEKGTPEAEAALAKYDEFKDAYDRGIWNEALQHLRELDEILEDSAFDDMRTEADYPSRALGAFDFDPDDAAYDIVDEIVGGKDRKEAVDDVVNRVLPSPEKIRRLNEKVDELVAQREAEGEMPESKEEEIKGIAQIVLDELGDDPSGLDIREAVDSIGEENFLSKDEILTLRREVDTLLEARKAPEPPEEGAEAPGDAEFDEMFTTPEGAYKPRIFDLFTPRGRTTESAEDYTDDPAVLAGKFDAATLGRALREAVLPDGGQPASGEGLMPFDDGDEMVPAEALYEALQQSGIDADMILAGIYDRELGETDNVDKLKQRRDDLVKLNPEDAPDLPGIKARSPREQEIEAARARNRELGRPGGAQRAVDLMDEYGDEKNPGIVEVADELLAAAESGELGEDNLTNLLAKYLPWSRGTAQQREAFRALWGVVMSIDGGDSSGTLEEGPDLGADSKSIQGIVSRAIEMAEGLDSVDIEDAYAELIETYGGFPEFVAGRNRIANGEGDLDDGSVAAAFYRLSKLAAKPSTVPLARSIGMSEDDPLASTYMTVGATFPMDSRSFTANDLAGKNFASAMQFRPEGDATQFVFIAEAGDMDSFSIAGASWFGENEHLGVGTYEVTDVKKVKDPFDKNRFKYFVTIKKSARKTEAPSEEDIFEDTRPNVDDWEMYSGQAGSNEGGFYRDPDGNEYYVKVPKSQAHAENEALAAALYELTGTPAARTILGDSSEGTRIVSPLIPGAVNELEDRLYDEDYIKKLRDGFVVDAWLANWDVAGLVYDNVMSDADGNPVRVDPGGALIFRARGSEKGKAFGDSVGELDTLRDPDLNPQNSRIFGGITDQELVDQANRLRAIEPEAIDAVVDSIVSDPEMASTLKTRLRNRRADILRRILGVDESEANELPTTTATTGTKYASKDLVAGDMTVTDSFVIESVFTDGDTPKGKVSVQGYFPGHESQRKEWGPDTEIEVFRGGAVPPKGDKPALHRPQPPRKPSDGAFTGEMLEKLRGVSTWQEAMEIIGDTEIIFFDYETTGLPDRDKPEIIELNRPVQIGGVRIRNGEIIDRFNSYMNPDFRLSEWSRNNLKRQDGEGLTDEWLQTQPSMKEAHEAFISWAGGAAILGGQYVPFDREVLERTLREQGLEFNILGTIDTKDIAAATLPKWSEKKPDGPFAIAPDGTKKASNSLGPIATYLGVEPENWHRADADAAMAANVLNKLLERAVGKPDTSTDILDADGGFERREAALRQYEADLEAYKVAKADYETAKALAAAWNCGMTAAKKSGSCNVPSVDDMVKAATVQPGETADPDGVPGGSTKNPSSMADSGVENISADGKDATAGATKQVREALKEVDKDMSDALEAVDSDTDVKLVVKKGAKKAVERAKDVLKRYRGGELSAEQAQAELDKIIGGLDRKNDDLDYIATEIERARDVFSGKAFEPVQDPDLPPMGATDPKTGRVLGIAKDGTTILKPGMLVRGKNGFEGVVDRYANKSQWHGVFVIDSKTGKKINKVTWSLEPINPSDATGGFKAWDKKAREKYEQAVEDGKLPKAEAPSGATPDEAEKLGDEIPEPPPLIDAESPEAPAEDLLEKAEEPSKDAAPVITFAEATKSEKSDLVDLMASAETIFALSTYSSTVGFTNMRNKVDDIRDKLEEGEYTLETLKKDMEELVTSARDRFDKHMEADKGFMPGVNFESEVNDTKRQLQDAYELFQYTANERLNGTRWAPQDGTPATALPPLDILKHDPRDLSELWLSDFDAEDKKKTKYEGIASLAKLLNDDALRVNLPGKPGELADIEKVVSAMYSTGKKPSTAEESDSLYAIGLLAKRIGDATVLTKLALALRAETISELGLSKSDKFKSPDSPSAEQIAQSVVDINRLAKAVSSAASVSAAKVDRNALTLLNEADRLLVLKTRVNRMIESAKYQSYDFSQRYNSAYVKVKEREARKAPSRSGGMFDPAKPAYRDIDADPVDWSTPASSNILSIDDATQRSVAIKVQRDEEIGSRTTADIVQTLGDGTDIEDMVINVVTGMAPPPGGGPQYVSKTRYQYKLTSWASDDFFKDVVSKEDSGFTVNRDQTVPNARYEPSSQIGIPGEQTLGTYTAVSYDVEWKDSDTESGTWTKTVDVDGYDVTINYVRSRNSGDAPLKAFDGFVSVDVPEGTPTQVVAKALQAGGVRDPGPGTSEALQLLIENRMVSVLGGRADPTVYVTDPARRREVLDSIFEKYGVRPEDFTVKLGSGGKVEIVGPPSLGKAIRNKTGVDLLHHTITTTNFSGGSMSNEGQQAVINGIADMLKDGQALRSSVQRALHGSRAVGQSTYRDIETGGADYVFFTPSDMSSGMASHILYGEDSTSGVTFVYDSETMFRRIDFYANEGDYFGFRTVPEESLEPTTDYVIDKVKRTSYEVMFKGEVSHDDIGFILVSSRDKKDALVKALEDRGVTEIGGKPIRQVVTFGISKDDEALENPIVQKYIDPAYIKFIRGAQTSKTPPQPQA